MRVLCQIQFAILATGCSPFSIVDSLATAVQSNDAGEITRAFHGAIYDRFRDMDEALPAVRQYLDHPSPFVRVRAAETLYTAGDRSGYAVLIALVQSPESQMDGQQDLRVKAASVLAKHRETKAIREIRQLYSRTSAGELLSFLATLHARASEAKRFLFIASSRAIENYAQTGATEFVPQLVTTFDTPASQELKNAAAYALARLTGEQRYVAHLSEAAQPCIDSKPRAGQLSFNDSTKALRYLGSIDHPTAREVLDRALSSGNQVAIRYGVVNLLFNQPGEHSRAVDVVLNEINHGRTDLGVDLTFHIAAALKDPEVRAAAAEYDRRTGNRFWREYGIRRKGWPIYNWIDDYVEDLRGNGA